jgi:hypothetical protein
VHMHKCFYCNLLFEIKSMLFGNRRDIVCVRSLACLVIGCTLIAHERIRVYKRLNSFLKNSPYFERLYFIHLKLKWRFVHDYRGTK